MDKCLEELQSDFNISINEFDSFNNNFEIIVTGDCNDADYNTQKTSLNLKQFKNALPYLKRFFEKCEDYDHNVEHFDEIFNGMDNDLSDYISMPSDDWGYCHTITDIEIYFYSKTDKKIYIINV